MPREDCGKGGRGTGMVGTGDKHANKADKKVTIYIHVCKTQLFLLLAVDT